MKNLYNVQVGLWVFLCVGIGRFLEKEQDRLVAIFRVSGYSDGPYGNPSMYFGFCALACCVLSIIIGLKTRDYLPKVGLFLVVLSVCFGLFALMTISSPRGISLDESLWAWCICAAVIMCWSIIAGIQLNKAKKKSPYGDETILDDIEIE